MEGATDTNIPLSIMTGREITIKKSMIQYKHQNNIYTRKKSFIYAQLKWGGDVRKLEMPANVLWPTITE